MTTQIAFCGDTITIQAKFYNVDQVLIDSDTQEITFTAYLDEDLSVVTSSAATRDAIGVYHFDWTVPNDDGVVYVLEMEGSFAAKPQLKRAKVKAKFRP